VIGSIIIGALCVAFLIFGIQLTALLGGLIATLFSEVENAPIGMMVGYVVGVVLWVVALVTLILQIINIVQLAT
jgi:hypothetical protein